MIFEWCLLVFVGISSGVLVSAGTFAYITMIGIIPRLTSKTHTASCITWYEYAVIFGGSLGSIMYIFNIDVPLGIVGGILYGVGSGIFVGCLAIALAEIIDTLPIFAMRVKLKWGIPYIALSLALGKMAGSLAGLLR